MASLESADCRASTQAATPNHRRKIVGGEQRGRGGGGGSGQNAMRKERARPSECFALHPDKQDSCCCCCCRPVFDDMWTLISSVMIMMMMMRTHRETEQ